MLKSVSGFNGLLDIPAGHPAYTNFIRYLIETATKKHDVNTPLTPAETTELASRLNSIQAYLRMALSGLLPDSNVTSSGRVPLTASTTPRWEWSHPIRWLWRNRCTTSEPTR